MTGPVTPIEGASTQSKACLKNSASKSPILIFLFFHKAIKSELDGLHRAALAFATNLETGGDISSLLQRYYFFRAIYKHHCNAEDEVMPRRFLTIVISLIFWFQFGIFVSIYQFGDTTMIDCSINGLFRSVIILCVCTNISKPLVCGANL